MGIKEDGLSVVGNNDNYDELIGLAGKTCLSTDKSVEDLVFQSRLVAVRYYVPGQDWVGYDVRDRINEDRFEVRVPAQMLPEDELDLVIRNLANYSPDDRLVVFF